MVVIAAGGGGIPVGRNAEGTLDGLEAVVETEQVACMVAERLQAKVLLMVIEKDSKFILSHLTTETSSHLTLEELQTILERETLSSSSVQAQLWAAARFLQSGGEQVVITTLRGLPATLLGKSGLRIGAAHSSLPFFGADR